MRFRPKLAVLAAAIAVGGTIAGVASPAGPAAAGTGTPVFATYTPPAAYPNVNNAGEPSIGINQTTGALMYQAYASTYKAAFNDSVVPATATWQIKTPLGSNTNIDPILETDSSTGRTFAGGLAGECSTLWYSDNDGTSWQQMGNPCAGVIDHESIGSGPWKAPAPTGALYNRGVYYCAQTSYDMCVTSTNGGLTFGPPIPVLGACFSLHGHVKVSADGTVYLPNNNCGANVGGGISTSNGSSWNSYTIPASVSAGRGFDPSVATTPDNTLWEAWSSGSNYHPMVASSNNHGASNSWSTPVDLASTVSPAIVASTFQSVVAGDNGRVAVAFLGTTQGGGASTPFDNGYNGVWNLYVSFTYDNGITWSTVKASADPVQRGCIWDGGGSNTCRNLLDFMDANLTPEGRVVVGYADGCINACAGASGTPAQSTSAYATVARQSTGKGLKAAYDALW
jgi:hypothetical protein